MQTTDVPELPPEPAVARKLRPLFGRDDPLLAER